MIIEIDFECESCGNDLEVKENSENKIIKIEPCEECLKDATKEGYDDGYEDGLDEGHSQGIEEGEENAKEEKDD